MQNWWVIEPTSTLNCGNTVPVSESLKPFKRQLMKWLSRFPSAHFCPPPHSSFVCFSGSTEFFGIYHNGGIIQNICCGHNVPVSGGASSPARPAQQIQRRAGCHQTDVEVQCQTRWAGGWKSSHRFLTLYFLPLRNEGAVGFYKGIVPNVIRVTPACCITFVVYENMSAFLLRRNTTWAFSSASAPVEEKSSSFRQNSQTRWSGSEMRLFALWRLRELESQQLKCVGVFLFFFKHFFIY